MQLSITRKGLKAESCFSPRQEYVVHLRAFPRNKREIGHIEFGFETNAKGEKGSDFTGYIEPKQFKEFAELMIKADPQAAIRAFGAVMQSIEIQEQPNKQSSQAA